MRIVRISFAAALTLLWAGPSQAGDHFAECVAPGSELTLDLDFTSPEPQLFEGEKKLEYKLVRKITILEKEGLCTAKDGQKFEWSSHDFLYEITTIIDGETISLLFLCAEYHSGVPAGVPECTETTTKEKRLQPTYAQPPK